MLNKSEDRVVTSSSGFHQLKFVAKYVSTFISNIFIRNNN